MEESVKETRRATHGLACPDSAVAVNDSPGTEINRQVSQNVSNEIAYGKRHARNAGFGS
jgi:hypothetical protein